MRIYLLTLLAGVAFFLSPFNLVQAEPSFPYGGVAVMHQSGCSETDYAAASDSDTARGTALTNAVAAAVDGDTLYASSGTFDGLTTLDFSLGNTGTVNFHGVGQDVTILRTSNGIIPGISGFIGSDFTETTTVANNAFSNPFGTYTDYRSYLNGWLKNVTINGTSDGIHFAQTTGTVDFTFINVSCHSFYDCVNITTAGTRNYYDSNFTVTDNGVFPPYNPAHAMQDLSATAINVWNSTFTASSTGGTGGTYGAFVIAGANFYNSVANADSPTQPVYTSSEYGNYWNYFTAGFLGTDGNGHGSVNVSPSTTYSLSYATPTLISEVPEVVPSLPAETCQAPLPATRLAAFNFYALSPFVTGTITESTKTVALIVPFGTEVTSLSPNIAIPVGATISPTSGTPESFTSPVVYTVTASDGVTTSQYTVTVTVAGNTAATLSSSVYTVDSTLNTIIGIPFATDAVTTLTSNLTPATGATLAVFQSDGVTPRTGNVLTGDKVIVTAQDTTTKKTYTLTVALNPAKAITAFSFPQGTGVINGTNISATVPFGTDVRALVATFTTTGSSVSVGATNQVSGTTANDFTNPQTYNITAADTTTQNYIVTITVAATPSVVHTSSGGRISPAQLAILFPSTIPTTSTPPITTYNFGTTTLKNGSRGEAVKELQRFLNKMLNLGLVVDGEIGPKTIAVIKKWQKANGLAVDGIVGAKTKAKMYLVQ